MSKMRVFYESVRGAITDADGSNSEVHFVVFDNEDKELDTLVIDGNDLPSENQHRSFLYGINKLLTDRTSGEKDKVAKLVGMSEYFDLLCTGEWSKERVVGAIVVGVEVEALAKLQELSIPQAQAALAQYDKDDRKRILGSEKVQAKAKEIREAREGQEVAKLDEYLS